MSHGFTPPSPFALTMEWKQIPEFYMLFLLLNSPFRGQKLGEMSRLTCNCALWWWLPQTVVVATSVFLGVYIQMLVMRLSAPFIFPWPSVLPLSLEAGMVDHLPPSGILLGVARFPISPDPIDLWWIFLEVGVLGCKGVLVMISWAALSLKIPWLL